MMAAWPYNTSTWQRLREAKLSVDPLCEVCIRREVIEPARAVDHVVAIAKGGPAFPPVSGLMSMCLPCHSYKTNMEDRPDRKRKLGSAWKGSAVDGGSLDPHDDWGAPAARPGPLMAPGAESGLEIDRAGPARNQRKELVSKFLMNNASSFKDIEQWV